MEQQVMQLLAQAQEHSDSVRKPAEQKLQELKAVPGFKLCLFEIASGGEQVAAPLRVLAAIMLKSVADKLWRRKTMPAADLEEKEAIKSRLLQNFSEPNERLAKQVAMIVAQCARWDWPQGWPHLFPALFQALESPNQIVVLRGLETLQQVLKMLSAKRLAIARRQFEEVSNELFGRLCAMWMARANDLVSKLQGNLTPEVASSLVPSATLCRLYMKCLLPVIVSGIRNLDQNPDAVRFFPALLEALKVLCNARTTIPESHPLHEIVTKLIKVMAKIVIQVQSEHPLKFRANLMSFMAFFNQVLQGSFTKDGDLVFESLTIQALTFFAKVIGCRAYSAKPGIARTATFSVGGGVQFDQNAAAEAKQVLGSVLSDEYVSNLARLLITQYFPLRRIDLEMWEDEPETYIEDENLALSSEKIRPASENLFTALLNFSPRVVGKVCVDLLIHVMKVCPPSPTAPAEGTEEYKNMLCKEAVFFAVGSGGIELADAFEQHNCAFSGWFGQFLQAEMSTTHAGLKIIRRRSIWMIGEWVRLVPDQIRAAVYASIVHLMQDSDIIVRLATAKTLQSLVDDMAFEATIGDFLPILSNATDQLFALMGQVKTLELKNQVMHVLRQMVETLGPQVYPAIGSLVQHLPVLWDTCQSENILRNSILLTLNGLVRALKAESVKLHSFVIPVLQFCTTDTQSTEKAFMVESAIDLWHATVQYATSMTPELMGLFTNWLQYHVHTTEFMETTIPILESYVLLGGSSFMTTHANNIAQICQNLCTRVRDVGVEMICKVLETCCQLFPQQFPGIFSNFIEMIIADIVASSNKATNSKRDLCIVAYLMILSRLMFQNFSGVVQVFAQHSNNNNNLLGGVLDLMCDKMDCMSEIYKKKLCCLAMASCFQLKDPSILQRVSNILGCCTVALVDLADETPPSYPEVDAVPEQLRTEEERIKLMVRQDPVNHVHLGKFVMEKLMACKQTLGPDFDKMMGTVDPTILAEIQKHAA